MRTITERSDQQGQAVIQMAIALPILLVLLLSIWQLSVVYGTWRTLHDAASHGARAGAAARHGRHQAAARAAARAAAGDVALKRVSLTATNRTAPPPTRRRPAPATPSTCSESLSSRAISAATRPCGPGSDPALGSPIAAPKGDPPQMPTLSRNLIISFVLAIAAAGALFAYTSHVRKSAESSARHRHGDRGDARGAGRHDRGRRAVAGVPELPVRAPVGRRRRRHHQLRGRGRSGHHSEPLQR